MDRPPRTRREQKQNELVAALRAVAPGTLVKSVRAAGKDEHRVSVRIGGDVRITVARRDADAAGLVPGAQWNPTMAERTIDAMLADIARRLAMSSIRRRAQSRGQVIDRLTRQGTPRPVALRVADELAEIGAIDDAAFADAAARSIVSQRPAGKRLIEMKLRNRRIDGGTARAAAEEALRERDVLADALAVARKHARTLPEKLDAPARQRRLLGALARRGFDPGVCFEAVRKTLGKAVDDPAAPA